MSGPVRKLTQTEIEAMTPNEPTPRRNVTAEENAKLAAEREPAERSLVELQQAGTRLLNREMAFCERASDAALAGSGTMSSEQFERFAKLMAILKQHLIEERQAPPSDPSKMTDEQIAAELAKRGAK